MLSTEHLEFIEGLKRHSDSERAQQMSKYMKFNFPYLGIQKPALDSLTKSFINNEKKSKEINWELVFFLWDKEQREYHYTAMNYLIAMKKYLKAADIHALERLMEVHSWWDSIDTISPNLVGQLYLSFPSEVLPVIMQWAVSENLWLNRAAILFQLKYKSKTDTALLSKIINLNKDTKEFFKNKAIGWILREYSKTNSSWVSEFIRNTQLHSLSVREGSKYI